MSIKLMSLAWETELSGNDKLVLLKLCDNANDEGTECFPSVSNISAKTGASRSTVKYILKALDLSGFIKKSKRLRENGSATSNGYEIIRFDIPLEEYTKAYQKARHYEPKSHNVTPLKSHIVTPLKPHCDPLYEPSIFNHPKKSIKKDEKNMHTDMNFRKLILDLYSKVPYKSKVKNNLDTYTAYKLLEELDPNKLLENYMAHQQKEKKYASNFENYLMDYETILAEQDNAPVIPMLGLGT